LDKVIPLSNMILNYDIYYDPLLFGISGVIAVTPYEYALIPRLYVNEICMSELGDNKMNYEMLKKYRYASKAAWENLWWR